jgi:hypothetical protein
MNYFITGLSCLTAGLVGGVLLSHYFPNFRAWLAVKIGGK